MLNVTSCSTAACRAAPEASDTAHLQTSISTRAFQLRMLKPSRWCSVITKEMLLHFLCVRITWIPCNIYFAVLFFVAHLRSLNLSQDEGKAEGWQLCSETRVLRISLWSPSAPWLKCTCEIKCKLSCNRISVKANLPKHRKDLPIFFVNYFKLLFLTTFSVFEIAIPLQPESTTEFLISLEK